MLKTLLILEQCITHILVSKHYKKVSQGFFCHSSHYPFISLTSLSSFFNNFYFLSVSDSFPSSRVITIYLNIKFTALATNCCVLFLQTPERTFCGVVMLVLVSINGSQSTKYLKITFRHFHDYHWNILSLYWMIISKLMCQIIHIDQAIR